MSLRAALSEETPSLCFRFNLIGELMEKLSSLVDGLPKCPKCSEQNELANRKGSEGHKEKTKILGNTAELVGT
jgi:hypothetical protein